MGNSSRLRSPPPAYPPHLQVPALWHSPCLLPEAVMLKITLHDSSQELRFQLEGRLSGAWVGELRQCWQTAASTTHGRSTLLDLDEVDFVDPSGQILLTEMHRAGVRIRAATPLIPAPPPPPETQTRRPTRHA